MGDSGKKSKHMKKSLLLTIALVLGISLLFIACGTNDKEKSGTDSTSIEQKDSVKNLKTWSYEEKKDEMSGDTLKTAILKCDEPVQAEDGHVRKMAIVIQDNKTVKLMMDNTINSKDLKSLGSLGGHGKFDVKFDENEPETFKVSRKRGEDHQLVHIDNSTEFIKKCQEAKKIVIRTQPLFIHGTLTFVFTVDEPLKSTE